MSRRAEVLIVILFLMLPSCSQEHTSSAIRPVSRDSAPPSNSEAVTSVLSRLGSLFSSTTIEEREASRVFAALRTLSMTELQGCVLEVVPHGDHQKTVQCAGKNVGSFFADNAGGSIPIRSEGLIEAYHNLSNEELESSVERLDIVLTKVMFAAQSAGDFDRFLYAGSRRAQALSKLEQRGIVWKSNPAHQISAELRRFATDPSTNAEPARGAWRSWAVPIALR